jgi:spermidine synthase
VRSLCRFLTLLLVAEFGLLVQATTVLRAYLPAASMHAIGLGAGLLALLAGAWSARGKSLPWHCVAAATLSAATGLVPFFSFTTRTAETAPTVVTALALAAGGATAASAARAFGRWALTLGFVGYVLSPFRLIGLAVAFVGLAALCAAAGTLRAGFIVALPFALAGAWFPAVLALSTAALARAATAARAVAELLLLAATSGFVATQSVVPLREVQSYAQPIVWTGNGTEQRYVVVSSPYGFELFVDHQLEVASLDAHRYYASLVGPALEKRPGKKSVLLLWGGTGLAEREVLRDPSVSSLVVVCADARLPDLARSMRWLASRSGGALDSQRIRIVAAEPMVWLERSPAHFDLVIADLPAPTDYVAGKYYTAHFLGEIERHLAPGGLAVIPAVSAVESPRTHSHIVATARLAGLEAQTYRAAVPSLGEWSFLLLSEGAIAGASVTPADSTARNTQGCTLDAQLAVSSFREEQDQATLE